jgi:immune inhibitor A
MNVLDTGYQHSAAVSQYGADYLLLDRPGTYDISFDGSDQVDLMGAAPTSGDWMWWSYNNSAGASHLTGAFDFSQLQTATLEFSVWWDIEQEYDWFQVLVSRDGGRSWEIVGGDHAQSDDPSKPGPYYSGPSSRWMDETIDLGAYVGVPVLIRFEYLTDNSGVMPGVALDDIRIPELFYLDDVENPLSVWHAEGFLRIPQSVPQNWTVAVVQQTTSDHATISPLELGDLHTGRAAITVPDGNTATLVIGAMAPFAAERATYKVAIQRQG